MYLLAKSMFIGGTALSLLFSPIHTKTDVSRVQANSVKINYLKEFNGDKEDIRNNAYLVHKMAIDTLNTYAAEHNIHIMSDIDNRSYQLFVKQFGGDVSNFNENEGNAIIEFVKFIDIYENYDQNKIIKQYQDQLEFGEQLTESQISNLMNIMPTSTAQTVTTEEDIPIPVEEGPEQDPATDPTLHDPSIVVPRPPEEIMPPEEVSPASNGYYKYNARSYAYTWTTNDGTKLRNNATYPYYSDYYDCTSCWNDCTNFVSQALKAGGMKYWEDGFFGTDQWNWYYKNSKPSHSWGGAHNFYNHWKKRAGVASSSSALTTGDVVNADFSGDGHIDHTAIITRHDSAGKRYLTQHTTDKEETTTLSNWYSSGYTVYGYEIDKASN